MSARYNRARGVVLKLAKRVYSIKFASVVDVASIKLTKAPRKLGLRAKSKSDISVKAPQNDQSQSFKSTKASKEKNHDVELSSFEVDETSTHLSKALRKRGWRAKSKNKNNSVKVDASKENPDPKEASSIKTNLFVRALENGQSQSSKSAKASEEKNHDTKPISVDSVDPTLLEMVIEYNHEECLKEKKIARIWTQMYRVHRGSIGLLMPRFIREEIARRLEKLGRVRTIHPPIEGQFIPCEEDPRTLDDVYFLEEGKTVSDDEGFNSPNETPSGTQTIEL